MNTRMTMTLDKFAKSEKYDLILNKAYTLEEDADITDSFLKQLEALK
jgi:Skp family chaperone for outer membrane proteins